MRGDGIRDLAFGVLTEPLLLGDDESVVDQADARDQAARDLGYENAVAYLLATTTSSASLSEQREQLEWLVDRLAADGSHSLTLTGMIGRQGRLAELHAQIAAIDERLERLGERPTLQPVGAGVIAAPNVGGNDRLGY